MLTDAIKQQILSLAIRGKLTDQRPEDGTAEELYHAILAERKRLIKAGKLKKEKPLPPIVEEEIPFDIPKNWKWVRLGEIGSWSSGATPLRSNPEYFGGNIPWLKTGDLTDGLVDDVPEYITEKALNETSVKLQPAGAVLIAMYGATIGKLGILTRPMTTNQACCACIPHNGIDRKFLFYFLMASRQKFIERGEGGAQPNISKEKITAFLLPLPTLPEQERIVEKLEAIMTALQDLETAQQRAQSIKRELRKSLLQEAIQGKLTDQRPEDGSAEELYRSILAEKKRLIKAGKLKKEKPLPPLEEKDIPFDIPENWKWVRLGEVGSFERGSGIKKTETVQEGLPCVRYGQLYTTFRTRFTEAVSYIPRPLFDVCKKAKCGDILMSLTGENNFDIALAVAYEGKDPLAIGGDMTRYTPCSVVPMYLVTVLNSGHGISCKSKLATGDIIVHISNDKLASIPIPLPPPAEQERIVAKLEELLPLCD